MSPTELYRAEKERRAGQISPILAECRAILDAPSQHQFSHRSTSGRGVACACPPEKEAEFRRQAAKAGSINELARTMGWSPRTAAKHLSRLEITLGS